MKKWFYIIGALMILLIAAYFTLPKEEIESTSIQLPEANPQKEAVAPQPYIAEGFIPVKVYEDNMNYYLSTQSFNDKEFNVFIKGTKKKIIFSKIQFNRNKEKFDTLYLDTQTKSAIAYCEKRVNFCDNSTKGLFVLYTDYNLPSPLDWIELVKQEKVIRTEYVNNRQASLIEFQYQKSTSKIWIDETYSLPTKVEVSPLEKYYYVYSTFNSVKDEDVLPKSF